MWIFITVLLVATLAEVNTANDDEKASVKEEESSEENSEEEQYDDDHQKFEMNEEDSLSKRSENQSHPPG
ncbi:unnamed protein product [Cercopithifilaria johnstoni]|uniref:Uncharacterized protein n=1 Tax=Cercopithifilaria johnstoni TaxID=2874296 RepID=A0A8J2M259_9BILA|nr:unnamed protein product [Cercopithifilaria johnstoni]